MAFKAKGDAMAGDDFFTRQTAEFAQQAGLARDNVGRQAEVERLIGKAQYECTQLRRDLAGLVDISAPLAPAQTAGTEARSETKVEIDAGPTRAAVVPDSAKAA
jgi:hypothetical protein